jgi:hypothetical protein
MKELDRLATTGKMIDQGIVPPSMPMAPQGMAPQGMAPQAMPMAPQGPGMKKGGVVKAKTKAKASSASKRADGCAIKGKTRGKMV